MSCSKPGVSKYGLSKSRYIDGQQCVKKLWLRVHEPDAPELDLSVAQRALFAAGHEVGQAAREEFPTGVLIDVDSKSLKSALDQTKEVMAAGAEVIFEASFFTDGVFVAVDVLEKTPIGWRIIECKASNSTKPYHMEDAALQAWVLRECGLIVDGVEVMHLNREYRHPHGSLFVREDVSAEVARMLPQIPDRILEMLGALEGPIPEETVGAHCSKPFACPFVRRCTSGIAKNDITELHGIRWTRVAKFRRMGVETIDEIGDNEKLTETQMRQRASILQKRVIIESGIREALDLPRPIAYMDFETIMFPLPSWEDCRPWQSIPAQWSVHVEEEGRLEHREFIPELPGDPRSEFVESLLEATKDCQTVVVWNESFEKARLRELGEAFPTRGPDLQSLSDRIVDLMKIVRAHVYHPNFRGSFSLKTVGPALLGDGWADLDIEEGATAAALLDELLRHPHAFTLSEAVEARRHLRAYCKRDTEMLVLVMQWLRAAAAQEPQRTGKVITIFDLPVDEKRG